MCCPKQVPKLETLFFCEGDTHSTTFESVKCKGMSKLSTLKSNGILYIHVSKYSHQELYFMKYHDLSSFAL